MALGRELSISQVQCYLGCPLKYRFQYVDKVPRPWRAATLAFGTSIHAAVEWFWRERMNGSSPAPSAVIDIFRADWHAQNLEPLVFSERESREALAQKGEEMLAVYLAAAGPTEMVAVERAFSVDLWDPQTGEVLDVRLRGYIDQLEVGDVLVDLKTAARGLESGGLERHLQLSTYALAHVLEFGRIPRLRLDMLLKLKVPRLDRLETTRTVEELSWTAQLIRAVSVAIETEHFYPSPSWRCSECEYFAHCQKWRGQEYAHAQPLMQVAG